MECCWLSIATGETQFYRKPKRVPGFTGLYFRDAYHFFGLYPSENGPIIYYQGREDPLNRWYYWVFLKTQYLHPRHTKRVLPRLGRTLLVYSYAVYANQTVLWRTRQGCRPTSMAFWFFWIHAVLQFNIWWHYCTELQNLVTKNLWYDMISIV